jgi:hypothetical protein
MALQTVKSLLAIALVIATPLVAAQDITVTSVSVPPGNTIEVGKLYDVGVEYSVTPTWSYDVS